VTEPGGPARAAGAGPELPGAELPGSELSAQARLTAWAHGLVQGVGFRWWVRRNALELGLAGMAENLADGRVKIVAEGHRDRCQALLERLEGPGVPGRVDHVTYRWDQATGGLSGFTER